MQAHTLTGFNDLSRQSNDVFRSVLNALSNPGQISSIDVDLPTPEYFDAAATAILLALADFETPLWVAPDIADGNAQTHLKFHTGCPIAEDLPPASFAIATAQSDFSFLDQLALGSSENPHNSTTLILMLKGFVGTQSYCLSGPGIKTKQTITPEGFPADVLKHMKQNTKNFPCGTDLILTSDRELMGIPRSTRLEN